MTQEVGGRTVYQAGLAITCGPLQVITGVTRPQTSHRTELYSFAVATAVAGEDHELTYDNKAVGDRALQPPHRECFNLDLRITIHEETLNKPLWSRWVPNHRDITKARTKEERVEVTKNDEVDRLAKSPRREVVRSSAGASVVYPPFLGSFA